MTTGLPKTMTAIEIPNTGGPEVLTPTSRPVPEPGPGEILVKVEAAGINRPDVGQRRGFYPAPPGVTDIPGLEIAGKAVAIGENVTKWKQGDELCALVVGGGYAEYCLAPEPQCLPIPKGLSAIEAAAIPETFFTVWDNAFTRGRLQKGETFLVHGGSSGIGTTAIQLAHAIGAKVFTTARTAEKIKACEALGAERGINYEEEDFVEVVKELTGGKGVDLILDMIGGDYVARNLEALGRDGRLVLIGVQHGPKAEVPLMPLIMKRITFTGSALRARSVPEKASIAEALKENVWPLLDSGKVKPVIHATFPLAEASASHALMESSTHIGKIVLTM